MASANESQLPATSAAEMDSGNRPLPVLDREAMLATVERDLELLRELAEIFFAESPALMAQLRSGLLARKAEAVERAAHTLKGAVGNFGGRRAAQAARGVEDEARANRLDEAQRLVPMLDEELALLCNALSDYLREAGP